MNSLRCSVYGLGVMGAPIAGHISRAGHSVCVHDRDRDREAAWRAAHTASFHAPLESDVVLLAVSDAVATARLLAALLPTLPPGTMVIDHGTAPPSLLRGVAARHGDLVFVDAPLSGGAEAACEGTLAAFVGGEQAAIDRAARVLALYCAQIMPLGPLGSGCVAKAANQVAIAGIVRGLAEAAALARLHGLNPDRVLEALAGGNARSAQIPGARARLGAADDPGGADFRAQYSWLAKDLEIALALGDRSLAMARLVANRLRPL